MAASMDYTSRQCTVISFQVVGDRFSLHALENPRDVGLRTEGRGPIFVDGGVNALQKGAKRSDTYF